MGDTVSILTPYLIGELEQLFRTFWAEKKLCLPDLVASSGSWRVNTTGLLL
jgi:hypothetical protein